MKYLEELNNGDLFSLNNIKFVLSADFRDRNKKIQKKCVSINNGCIQWIDADTIVSHLELYHRDSEGNILPVKSFIDNDITKNSHIS